MSRSRGPSATRETRVGVRLTALLVYVLAMTKTPVIVSCQLPRDVRDELQRRAHADDRSLSSEIRKAIAGHLLREQAKGQA